MTQPSRPVLTPEEAAIVRLQRAMAAQRASRASGGLSRRSVLGGAGALGFAGLLSACGTSSSGTSGGDGDAKPSAVVDRSDTEKVVNWANWTLYLDYDSETKSYPTLTDFTQKTGIKANYVEDVDDNDTYYGKIQGQLKNGQDIGQDIVVFTDYMASRVIRQGYTQKFDQANIPNAKNIVDNLKNVDFDPGRANSLTWQSGYAGIAWNKGKIPEGMKTVSDLWNPKYKGKIEVLSEFRDTLGLIMLEQGVDISKPFTSEQFGKALDVLEKQIASGQIRQVRGNSYKEDLISGDAWAVIGWSGDITQLNFENDDQWTFLMPPSGATLWSDNMVIPIGSPHKKNAEILMNYYYDPVVAAKVAAYVNYICPVKGAREEISKLPDADPTLADNPYIFPAAGANAKVFRTLEPAEETEFTTAFQKVLGV